MTYDQAMMVKKIARKICPGNLKEKLTNRTQISKYKTCRMNDLQIPRSRLEISKKRFSYVGAKVGNNIPNNIRNVEHA